MIVSLISTLLIALATGDLQTCTETRATALYNSNYPKNLREYDKVCKEMKCTDIQQNCSTPSNFSFHVAITPYRNDTVFVCAPVKYIVGGYCVEFNFKGGRMQENWGAKCSSFPYKPCPKSYLSNEAYKFPLCFEKYGKPDVCSRDPLTIPYVQTGTDKLGREIIKNNDKIKNEIPADKLYRKSVKYALQYIVKLVDGVNETFIFKYPDILFVHLDNRVRNKNRSWARLKERFKSLLNLVQNRGKTIKGLAVAVAILGIMLIFLVAFYISHYMRKKKDEVTCVKKCENEEINEIDNQKNVQPSTSIEKVTGRSLYVNDEDAMSYPLFEIHSQNRNFLVDEQDEQHSTDHGDGADRYDSGHGLYGRVLQN